MEPFTVNNLEFYLLNSDIRWNAEHLILHNNIICFKQNCEENNIFKHLIFLSDTVARNVESDFSLSLTYCTIFSKFIEFPYKRKIIYLKGSTVLREIEGRFSNLQL